MPHPAIALFHAAFGVAPRAAASAPGRVNLLGAHTDYNGGPVLPIAIAARTTAAVGPAEAGLLEAVSGNGGEVVRIRWQEQLPAEWGAYVAGVLRELWAADALPAGGGGGARVAVTSDVPVGAGLASSAALTVAVAKAFSELAGAKLTARQVAGVAFRAVQDHVGVRSSVMDQTVAALAKPGHALLLECASLEVRQIPFRGRLLLVDTGQPPDLREGGLQERRAECEAAVKRLKMDLPELVWLASWPAEWLPRLKRSLKEPVRARAVHVVGETARTRFGAQLLRQRKLKQFGQLLYESHESCRRLYACSSPELDTVVHAAKRAGALGARLTGEGWGGAAIVLAQERGAGSSERVIAAIRRAFVKSYGREPAISEVTASAGARAERVL
jgi:galactokinase